jgi:hypothetical protein
MTTIDPSELESLDAFLAALTAYLREITHELQAQNDRLERALGPAPFRQGLHVVSGGDLDA